MSKRTKQVKVIVVSRGVITPSSICKEKERLSHRSSMNKTVLTFICQYNVNSDRKTGCTYKNTRSLTSNLSPEDKECSHDNHEGGGEDLSEQLAVDHSLLGLARWPLHYIMVHRLHAQAAALLTRSHHVNFNINSG